MLSSPCSFMRRLLLLLLFFPLTTLQADEWWAWSMLSFWRQPPWEGSVFLVNRLDDADGAFVQMVSPRVKYEASSWLDVGVNLSVLSIESAATDSRYLQLRPEVELTPKWDISEHLKLDVRNRMEWRLNEGEDFTVSRSRHRLQLAWTLPHPVGPLTRVFTSNEWLVDLHKGSLSEDRYIPLGVTLKTSASTDLDLFYMVLAHHTAAGWDDESVLGTYLRVRF